MRLAAIDIGTNSVHMIVVQVRTDFSFEVIDREKEMVRLGAGGLDGKSLTEAAMSAALLALAKFRRIAESHGVDEILAAATSATREAENGTEFLARIVADTGIRPRVISGTEEARLIHLAAVYGVDVMRGPAVVIDIGGGSVEITLGDSEHLALGRSFKMGVIRLTERFVTSDPLAARDERKMAQFIKREINQHASEIVEAGFDRVIGTSGTILSLGTMAAHADHGHAPGEIRNLRIPVRQLHRLRKQVVSLELQHRLKLPGLEPRRSDIVVAGAVLLDTILRRLGATEITLCDLALREGLVLDYIQRNREQIARLAVSLFEQTRGIHGLGDGERDWLEYAALMHDLGVHISYEKHHRHSYYLVKHGDLRGFDPQEIEVMALVTRYHRAAPPKKSHDGFGALPRRLRRTVRTLAAILRLAEGLDRSHSQPLAAVDLHDRGDDALIQLRTSGDAELELWAAHRHVIPFERMLGKPVRFEIRGTTSHAEHAH